MRHAKNPHVTHRWSAPAKSAPQAFFDAGRQRLLEERLEKCENLTIARHSSP
jgi:hypothetical protein